MSMHTASLYWERDQDVFEYDTFNRNHTWTFDNGHQMTASSATDFKGDPTAVDPEEALVASLAACHMLTFLALTAKKRIKVKSYEDRPEGVLEKNQDGKLAITRITLSPRVVFDNVTQPSSEDILALHQRAHEHCFIANSIRAEVKILPAGLSR